MIHIVVVDSTGDAISKALVWIAEWPANLRNDVSGEPKQTGADGGVSFSWDTDAPAWGLVYHEAFVPRLFDTTKQTRDKIRVTLEHTRSLTVRVLDMEGNSIPKAEVEVESPLLCDVSYVLDGVPNPEAFMEDQLSAQSLRSGTDGTVSLSVAASTRCRVTCRADLYFPESIEILPRAAERELSVVLRAIVLGAVYLPKKNERPLDFFLWAHPSGPDSSVDLLGQPSTWLSPRERKQLYQILNGVVPGESVKWFLGRENKVEDYPHLLRFQFESFVDGSFTEADIIFLKVHDFTEVDVLDVLTVNTESFGPVTISFVDPVGFPTSPRHQWKLMKHNLPIPVFDSFGVFSGENTPGNNLVNEKKKGLWEALLPIGDYVISGWEFPDETFTVDFDHHRAVEITLVELPVGRLRINACTSYGRPLTEWSLLMRTRDNVSSKWMEQPSYLFENLAEGDYVVWATRPGYGASDQESVLIRRDEETHIELILDSQ